MNINVELTETEIKEAIRYWLEHSKSMPAPSIAAIKIEYQNNYSAGYSYKATASLDGKVFEETHKKRTETPIESAAAGKKSKVSLDVD